MILLFAIEITMCLAFPKPYLHWLDYIWFRDQQKPWNYYTFMLFLLQMQTRITNFFKIYFYVSGALSQKGTAWFNIMLLVAHKNPGGGVACSAALFSHI